MKKVMIVDDSAFMRKVVTDLLNQLPDIEVTVAARNGKQALDYLTKEAIDLVVMDVEMPVMNGLETLRKMKQQSAIPVIMLSSLTNQETTIEALALGARDFVEKPVSLSMIEKEWIAEFHQKILAMDHEAGTAQALVPTAAQPTKLTQNSLSSHLDALVIGASTGGACLTGHYPSLARASALPNFDRSTYASGIYGFLCEAIRHRDNRPSTRSNRRHAD